MPSFLKPFDVYVNLGLKPIAVFKDSKSPVGEGWNENWSVDRWRPYFVSDAYNMGLLLDGIVDVEADTEEANDLLKRMIDGQKRPQFRSSKSTHNLFISPDTELQRYVFHGIEFRGQRHQSVVPPSTHEHGVRYRWLEESQFPIPKMPQELLEFYWRNKEERIAKQKTRLAHPKAQRPKKPGYCQSECRCCHNKFYIHEKRLILEVRAFREYGLRWMCHHCREFDLRDACRRIRKQMKPTRYVEPYASIVEGIESVRPRR